MSILSSFNLTGKLALVTGCSSGRAAPGPPPIFISGMRPGPWAATETDNGAISSGKTMCTPTTSSLSTRPGSSFTIRASGCSKSTRPNLTSTAACPSYWQRPRANSWSCSKAGAKSRRPGSWR